MRRLLLLTDIHGNERNVRKLSRIERDLTIVAGDIADCGGTVEEAHAILEELASQGPPVVWVPGNCDTPLVVEAPPPRNTFLIHGVSIVVEGLAFAGAGGGTYSPFSTPFEMSDEELGSVVEKAIAGRDKVDIVVTHVPPKESGLDRVSSGEYVGSVSLRSLLVRVRPRLHVCGHIHESWGVASIGGVLSINPGPLNWGHYGEALLDIEKGVVSVRLRKL